MQLVYVTIPEKPFYSFKNHSHEHWEILLVSKGSGQEIINGVSYPIKEGSIICLPAGTLHGSKSKYGMIDICLGVKGFPSDIANNLYFLEDDKDKSIEALLKILFNAITQCPENMAFLADSVIQSLYQLLLAKLSIYKDGDTTVNELKSIIMDNIGNANFKIADAMNTMSLSNGYIRKIFREETGLTPLEWMTQQKINNAKSIFQMYSKQYTIRQVSFMVGFSDQYYFSRKFKQVTGLTPTEYKLQLSKETMPTNFIHQIYPNE